MFSPNATTTTADARFALYPAGHIDAQAFASNVEAELASLNAHVGSLSPSLPNVMLLSFPGRILRQSPAVAFEAAYALGAYFGLSAVEPELYTDHFHEPSDEQSLDPEIEFEGAKFKSLCWAPENEGLKSETTWALRMTRVRAAWDFSAAKGKPSKGKGIVIAQPDTGITAHPELANVEYVHQRDLILGKNGAIDPLTYHGNPSHGTGTASVAISPETGDIVGSAPAATLMPIRAIESVVRVSQLRVAEAIDYAVTNGAHVITMSLGGLPSISLWMALQRAISANVIVLAAAGNCAKVVVWPARYEDCIAVAGTNSDDLPWRGSCTGPDVDISAPGENVYRAHTELGGAGQVFSLGQGQGTSFAVALTAGVAACWLAHHGRDYLVAEASARGESVQQMFKRLLQTTSREPEVWDQREMGAGIVDALALLKADLDEGRGESAVSLLHALPTSSIRSLAQSSAGVSLHDISLEQYGMELANTILEQANRKTPTSSDVQQPEAPAAKPAEVSGTLRHVLGGLPTAEQLKTAWRL